MINYVASLQSCAKYTVQILAQTLCIENTNQKLSICLTLAYIVTFYILGIPKEYQLTLTNSEYRDELPRNAKFYMAGMQYFSGSIIPM